MIRQTTPFLWDSKTKTYLCAHTTFQKIELKVCFFFLRYKYLNSAKAVLHFFYLKWFLFI